MFGVWTLVGPWNHFWWRPGSPQGNGQFFGGPTKHDGGGPTSLPDIGTRRRPYVGPPPGRWANDVDRLRRRADVNYRYVADVVLTSARRRRVSGKFEDPTPIRSWVMSYNVSRWLPLKMRMRMRQITWHVSRGSKTITFLETPTPICLFTIQLLLGSNDD